MFGFHVPLFMDGETSNGGKWGMWTFDELLLTCTYGYILFVHYSKWRDKLPRESTHSNSAQLHNSHFFCYYIFSTNDHHFFFPYAARPAFYNYVVVMFIVNSLALLACALAASGVGFGFWYEKNIFFFSK